MFRQKKRTLRKVEGNNMEQYVKIVPSDSGFSYRLSDEIRRVEKELSDNEELYIIINGLQFRIEQVKHDLNLLCIQGSDATGQYLELVCHEYNFSAFLVRLKKRVPEKPPLRIGFVDMEEHRE